MDFIFFGGLKRKDFLNVWDGLDLVLYLAIEIELV